MNFSHFWNLSWGIPKIYQPALVIYLFQTFAVVYSEIATPEWLQLERGETQPPPLNEVPLHIYVIHSNNIITPIVITPSTAEGLSSHKITASRPTTRLVQVMVHNRLY